MKYEIWRKDCQSHKPLDRISANNGELALKYFFRANDINMRYITFTNLGNNRWQACGLGAIWETKKYI